MIRHRLAKLEKLVATSMENCPGCARIPARILMPGDRDSEPDDLVRCDVCGRQQRPFTVRVVVPGLGSASIAAVD